MRVAESNEQVVMLLPPDLEPSWHITAKNVSNSRERKAPRRRDSHGKKVFASHGLDLLPIKVVTEVVQTGGSEESIAVFDTQGQYLDQLVSVGS